MILKNVNSFLRNVGIAYELGGILKAIWSDLPWYFESFFAARAIFHINILVNKRSVYFGDCQII